MADADLGALLEPHKSMLKDMAASLAAGDHAKLAASTAVLVGALATGNPQVAVLAPFAEKAVAKAFGNSADAMLRRELAAMEKEEERQRFVAQIAEPVEALKLLKHAYVDARYDPGFAITKEELAQLAERVRDLRDRVERVCRERIDAMTGA